MKSHISATIEEEIVEEAERFGRQVRRSRSQIIEMALEHFLREMGGSRDEIVTSPGRFADKFSREETYAR